MTTTMKKLPVVLEGLRIASPCSADWDEMTGDARVRFCGQCEKNVYNLSAMTRDEAESLVREKEGRVCVRMYQRADGTVITNDCPVGARRLRMKERIRMSLAKLTAGAALALGIMSGRARADLAVGNDKGHTTTTATDGKSSGRPHLMGKIAIKPETPEPPRPLMGAVAPAVMGEPVRVVQGDVAAPPPKKEPKPVPKTVMGHVSTKAPAEATQGLLDTSSIATK
jgi:hypothetical protein